jgi:putative ABC transport system permease protein
LAIRRQSLQLNFLLVGTPDPFAGAPATIIATVKTDPGREGDVLAAVTDRLPGVTGIDVRQILASLAGLLGEIGTAVSLVGLVALTSTSKPESSAIAAEREARIAEAVVLKTLGANRGLIRRIWLVEFAVAGGVAGVTAALLGTLSAYLTIIYVFHTDWHFDVKILLLTLLGSVMFMIGFGFAATAAALRAPAAARLRLETG